MEKLYTVKELAKKYNRPEGTLRNLLFKYKIKPEKRLQTTGTPGLYRPDDRLKRKKVKCEHCGSSFTKLHDGDKYCSKFCGNQARYIKKHGKNRTITLESVGIRDFEFGDRSYRVKKGLEDRKKIEECSIDCLLDEFGDLE